MTVVHHEGNVDEVIIRIAELRSHKTHIRGAGNGTGCRIVTTIEHNLICIKQRSVSGKRIARHRMCLTIVRHRVSITLNGHHHGIYFLDLQNGCTIDLESYMLIGRVSGRVEIATCI